MSTGDAGSLGTLFDSVSREVRGALDRALDGGEVSVAESDVLARTTGRDLAALTVVADELRRRQVGDTVTYVVNRNINFTNVCIKHCGFCAFSRDHREEEGYLLPIDEVVRRARPGIWAPARSASRPGCRPSWTVASTSTSPTRSRPPCPICTCTRSRPRKCSTAPCARACPSKTI